MDRGFRLFKTELGWCGYVSCDNGVVGIILPVESKELALELLEARWPGAGADSLKERTVQDQLERYFTGERVEFTFPLDFGVCSPFSGSVYRAAMTIPYGEVRSYGWVSRAVDRPGASRAVGRAMGSNPFPPVVPCHRVIKGDGTLGGFSAHMGLPLKARMLKMEGVGLIGGREITTE